MAIGRINVYGGTDLSFITAGTDEILEGYIGSDSNGDPVEGDFTLEFQISDQEQKLEEIEGLMENKALTYSIDFTKITATPEKILNGYIGVGNNGELITGTHTCPTDFSFVTATADKILSGYVGVDNEGNPITGTCTLNTQKIAGTTSIITTEEGNYTATDGRSYKNVYQAVNGTFSLPFVPDYLFITLTATVTQYYYKIEDSVVNTYTTYKKTDAKIRLDFTQSSSGKYSVSKATDTVVSVSTFNGVSISESTTYTADDLGIAENAQCTITLPKTFTGCTENVYSSSTQTSVSPSKLEIVAIKL